MEADLGIVGMGVMGANLARNVAGRGFTAAVHDRDAAAVLALQRGPGRGLPIVAAPDGAALAAALRRPRRVLAMVPAGAAVDAVIAALRPHLEPGDILIDGGNSHHRDTDRRLAELEPTGIRFVGMGVSGGQDGALRGPSLMPGGDRAAWEPLQPILTAIAARTPSGPCVTWVGGGSAGHFVKMVHNGIEYGDMQLIAEAYDLLRHGLGLEPRRVAAVFAAWNAAELQSFLVETAATVVVVPDDHGGEGPLVDHILDRAGQKGTGRWSIEAALEVGVAVPTLAAAVDARLLSGRDTTRRQAAAVFGAECVAAPRPSDAEAVGWIRSALYAAKICTYAQGFELLAQAGTGRGYGLRLAELARIWKGGCIIRAALLDPIQAAFERDPDLPSLIVDPMIAAAVRERVADWRAAVGLAQRLGIAVPALSTSLAWFDTLRRDRLPANLLQALRDAFGAHGYERRDRPGAFHSQWGPAPPPGAE